MRPIDVYLSIRPLPYSSTRASWVPGSSQPLRAARLDFGADSLLGCAFALSATDPSSPGDLTFHDVPSASVDRSASVLGYSPSARRPIEPLTPLSRSAMRLGGGRLSSSRPTAPRFAETASTSPRRDTRRRFPGPERLPPAGTLLGPSSAHVAGATHHVPTHDALSPATRARCLAAPRATRELRSPVTRSVPSGLGRSTDRASRDPTFAYRLLQHARPASTPRGPSILVRLGQRELPLPSRCRRLEPLRVRDPAANHPWSILTDAIRAACGAAASHEPLAPACADDRNPRAGRSREKDPPGATPRERRRKVPPRHPPEHPVCHRRAAPEHGSLERRARRPRPSTEQRPAKGAVAAEDRGCLPPYVSG